MISCLFHHWLERCQNTLLASKNIFILLLAMTGLLSACTAQDIHSHSSNLWVINHIDVERSQYFTISPHNHVAIAINAKDSNTDIATVLYASQNVLNRHFSQSSPIPHNQKGQAVSLSSALSQAQSKGAAFLFWLTVIDMTANNNSTQKSTPYSKSDKGKNKESIIYSKADLAIKSVHYDVSSGRVIDVVTINLHPGVLMTQQQLSHLLDGAITHYLKQLSYLSI